MVAKNVPACALYTIERSDVCDTFDVFPVIGLTKSRVPLYIGLERDEAIANIEAHAGVHMQSVMLTPTITLLEPRCCAVQATVAVEKVVTSPTPTELVDSSVDADDDVEAEELFDLFG